MTEKHYLLEPRLNHLRVVRLSRETDSGVPAPLPDTSQPQDMVATKHESPSGQSSPQVVFRSDHTFHDGDLNAHIAFDSAFSRY